MTLSPYRIKVALPLPIPQLFDYGLPENTGIDAINIGCRVRVPWGKRELIGWVAEINSVTLSDEPLNKNIRCILEIIDKSPLLHGELWQSLQWLSRYTHASLGDTIATALPKSIRQGEPLPCVDIPAWQLTLEGDLQYSTLRKNSQLFKLADYLHQFGIQTDAELVAQFKGVRRLLKELQERGYISPIILNRPKINAELQPAFYLNQEQALAVESIIEHSEFQPWVLDGVTGSGKTEVYLHCIAECLKQQKQALVLVPEIGLTPQLLERFQQRLGVPIFVSHSNLSNTERTRTWAAAAGGQAQVILGTRSAVFMPLVSPGLLILDEEHDSSYKQQEGIRYHARDFALVRAKALNIPIILGSATPSLESLSNVNNGRFNYLQLKQRAGQAVAPTVHIHDIRKYHLEAGLSPTTINAIQECLDSGQQVLVFKNRRGYAPVLLCHDCGWNAHCPHCSTELQTIALTVYANKRRLHCHHCDYQRATPPHCPECEAENLQPQGVGTERLEEYLSERFNTVPVIRIDRTTTQRKNALQNHLKTLGDQPGILIGTQILAKGHDLPKLNLVVVVGVDEGLFSVDFRAGEKMAQQLIQVAGRAGRAENKGQVYLQTHHPDHPLLRTLLQGGYHAFSELELSQREAANFPPFCYFALFRAEAMENAPAQEFLNSCKQYLLEELNAVSISKNNNKNESLHKPFDLFGAIQAPMPRRANYQRWQLVFSAQSRVLLHQILNKTLAKIRQLPLARQVRWSLDIDPIDLY